MLGFCKFKVALSAPWGIFLKFTKNCALYLTNVDNVAMVIYYVTKMITTSSPTVGQFFETMIIASDRVATTVHQNLSVGNCFEPP